MKTIKNFNLATLFAFTILMSCSTSDDNSVNPANILQQQIIQTTTTAQSGTWRIVSFLDNGIDETDNFFGYTFTFSSNGTVTAETLNDTESGTWSVSSSSSSSSSVDFNIFFNVPDTHDFDDLNDDWDILALDTNRIELQDISGGNGGTDTLIFQQN
jgi:hypothetical protein